MSRPRRNSSKTRSSKKNLSKSKKKKKKKYASVRWKKKQKAQRLADSRRSKRVVSKDKYPKGGTLYDNTPRPVSKLKSADFGDDHYFCPQSRLCPESKQSAPSSSPVNKLKVTKRMDPEEDNYFVSISRLCPEAPSKKIEKEIAEKSGELDRAIAKLTPLLESDEITQQEFDYQINRIRAQLQMIRRKTSECEKAKTQKQPIDAKCIAKWGLSTWSMSKKRPNLDRPAPKYRFQLSSNNKTFVASKVRCKKGNELKPLTIPMLNVEDADKATLAAHDHLHTCSICKTVPEGGTTFFKCDCSDSKCGVCLACLPRRALEEAKEQRDYLSRLAEHRKIVRPGDAEEAAKSKKKLPVCAAGATIRGTEVDETFSGAGLTLYSSSPRSPQSRGGSSVFTSSPRSQQSRESNYPPTNMCFICKKDVQLGHMLYDCNCEFHRVLGKQVRIANLRQVCRECLPERMRREKAEMRANAHRMMTRLCEPDNHEGVSFAWVHVNSHF